MALVAMVVGCCVRWFAVWTWAELLVNITTWLCLTAVVAVVGADWGGNPSGTTFRTSQSLFFATVVRLDYFLTIRLYSGSNFLRLDSIENIQHLAAIL